MPAEVPVAEKELALVGKVEFRIAAAETDAKLEALLKTYLAPLLLKLASEHQAVRNKVIAVCQHVNTRVEAPSIKLPVAALLKQFKENQNVLIRHFDLLYIQRGLERLPKTERLDLLPILLKDLAQNFSESPKSAATLFNLLLRLLHQLELPSRGSREDSELRKKLSLDNGKDAPFISRWIGKLFLYNGPTTQRNSHRGLSAADCDFLQLYDKPEAWSPATSAGLSLVETKVQAAKFLASGSFVEEERFLPAVIASSDLNSRLSVLGDDMLKRALPAVSTEDGKLITSLYQLYMGSPSDQVLPAPISLQTRLLSILSTSRSATEYTQEILLITKQNLALEDRTEGEVPEFDVFKPVDARSNVSAHKGLAASKLRTQVFNFVNWVARTASKERLSLIVPEVIASIRVYMNDQGWPTISQDLKRDPSELQLRAYGYESIGLLAKACPEVVLYEANLDLLRWFFQSLGGDASSKEVSLSIEQGMSSVLSAFANVSGQNPGGLVSLLSHYASLSLGQDDDNGITMQRNTRYMAVRFSNRCLPFSNVHGRLIALHALSAGDMERKEVIEEGRRGIDPYWYRILNPSDGAAGIDAKDNPMYAMPNFDELVTTLLAGGSNSLQSGRAFGDAVVFCWTILLHKALENAGKSPVIDSDWQRNIEALIRNDEAARDGVTIYLKEVDKINPHALTRLSRAAFEDYTRPDQVARPLTGKAIIELWQLGPVHLRDDSKILDRAADLKSTIFSSFQSVRILSSRMLGLLASCKDFNTQKNTGLLQGLYQVAANWEKAVGSEVHHVHGSLVAVAYALTRSKNTAGHDFVVSIEQDFANLVIEILQKTRDKDLVQASLLSVSQVSLYGILTPMLVTKSCSVDDFLLKTEEKAKKGDETAINALGHFAVQCEEGDGASSVLDKILATLYGLHEQRQAEVQFSVGSALSCAAIGWYSKALIGEHDLPSCTLQTASRTFVLQDMLDKILDDCKTTKPALRQASVIWLLCLVQYCGHKSEVQSRLRQCQVAFKGFLSDKESVNQEVASRGLSLIYEKGDRGLKDDLIRDLVTSFTSTKSNLSGHVSDETQLFEPGALPTGDGKSVTTYKDIISLANEVGDPSLVYRFMSLASNSAIWSSRSAFGRFGLSRVLSDASVDGYLANNPKLYSSLFRYRFDPNTNVRSAMNEIWTSLVRDPKAIIDQYFDSILQDLFKSILNKEWRTRQASCAAIADLLQGRPLALYEHYLTQIWELTFKVCDDIKGSVRTAAMTLARTLTGILTRSLEAGEASASTANAMLKQVLPFLLGPSGLESAAQDVQTFSLVTLIDIIKKANGKILLPFIPDLVARLLSLLTSIEPGVINYVYLNADKYGMTEQQIDDARLSSVKMSPMMEAIERCLDMLDESIMPDLEQKLVNASKTVIGLPSRVGLSRVMVSLATRHRSLFIPYAGSFLKLLRRQVMDRNDTISTSAAAACGYVARLAPDNEILGLVNYAQKVYFASEDDRHRTVAGEIVLAIAKHATDRFAALASSCLPFAYFGLHDTSEAARDLFKAAWEENAGGSRAVLLYLREIINLATEHLESQQWVIKHTAAFTVADAVKAESEISEANSRIMWPALEKAIGGKTWDGKEKVLEGLVHFWTKSNAAKSDPKVREAMEKIIVREAKRTNAAYRVHSFKALAKILEYVSIRTREGEKTWVDWFSTLFPIVESALVEHLDKSATNAVEDKMDVDAKSGSRFSSKDLPELTVANGLQVLVESIPLNHHPSPENVRQNLAQALPLIKKALDSSAYASRSYTLLGPMLDGLDQLLSTLNEITPKLDDTLDQELSELIATTLFTSKYDDLNEGLRQKTATTAASLGSFGRKNPKSKLRQTLIDGILQVKNVERSQVVLTAWNEVEKMLRIS